MNPDLEMPFIASLQGFDIKQNHFHTSLGKANFFIGAILWEENISAWTGAAGHCFYHFSQRLLFQPGR